MAPPISLVAALLTTSHAELDESSMLQMPMVDEHLGADQDSSECRCPGYYQAECEAEASQGCVWSDQGSSNKPWCQCLGTPFETTAAPTMPTTAAPTTAAPTTAAPTTAAPTCPNSGLLENDRCWYMSEVGATCGGTCSGEGLDFSLAVAGEESPMVPTLLGRDPNTRQFPWGRLECYVPNDDRYHTAHDVPHGNTGDNGAAEDWSYSVCQLACPCALPTQAPNPVLQNGNFETETFTNNDVRGYHYTNEIPGWTAAAGTVACQSGNAGWGGIQSEGTYYLALQSSGASIQQAVGGHIPGHNYYFHVSAAQRQNSPGGRNAILKITANGNELLREVIASASFQPRSFMYTADSPVVTLRLENDVASGDQTIFVDSMEIVAA